MSWSEFEKQMIELIKKDFPILYKQHPSQMKHDDDDVRDAWNSLATNFNDVTGQTCKIRWLNIQNHYFQLKKAIKEGKQYIIDMKSKYLDGTLSFLDTATEEPQALTPHCDTTEKINVHDDKQQPESFQAVVQSPQVFNEDLIITKALDRLAMEKIAVNVLKLVDNDNNTDTDMTQEPDIETSAFIKSEPPEEDINAADSKDAIIEIISQNETNKEDKPLNTISEPPNKKVKLNTDNTSNDSIEPKSILDLNCYESNNKKFFGELSEYVVNRFSLQKQREIRLQICGILKDSDITILKEEV